MAISSKDAFNEHMKKCLKLLKILSKKKEYQRDIIYMLNKLINSGSYGIYSMSKVPTHRAPKHHSLDTETLKILPPTHTV